MTSGKRIYVLDTNVLMHDPSALFKFEEHDIYLPMQVIEELDNGKKGTSDASRNARQASRFLDELVEGSGLSDLSGGISLQPPGGLNLRNHVSSGRLRFQTANLDAGRRLAANVPPEQRSHREVMRTDSAAYQAVLEAQRNRGGPWSKVTAGHVDLCNAPIPVREVGK